MRVNMSMVEETFENIIVDMDMSSDALAYHSSLLL